MMAKLAKESLLKLNKNRLNCLCLSVTLIFFTYKGIAYSIIGSYVPLLLISSVLGLFFYSLNKSPKALINSIGLWSVLIIFWSLIRIVLSIVNQFLKPIPEGHVDGQLGLIGFTISLAFLFAGVYMWRSKNKILE